MPLLSHMLPPFVRLVVLALCVLPWGSVAEAQPATQEESRRAQEERLAQQVNALPAEQRDWIRSVLGLITVAEIDYFVSSPSYRRDSFVEEFWRVRDPDPRTSRNELKERFEELRSQLGPAFSVADPRYRLFLLNGPPTGWSLPDGRGVTLCLGRSREVEIWWYTGSARTERRFVAVFFRRAASQPYELWLPGANLRPVQRSQVPSQNVRLLCAEELIGYAQREISRIGGYDQLLQELMEPPAPSVEWLAGLRTDGVEIPDGAASFEVEALVSYPTRRQSRTGVQVVLPIPTATAPGRDFGGSRSHSFVLLGEILREGRLFEDFRYRFEGPTPEGAATVPLGFTRFLRPGPAELKLRVEDVFGQQYARVDLDLEVPSPDGRAAAPGVQLTRAEAAPGERSLRLIAPGQGPVAGRRRFETRAVGEFERVAFFLDGRQVLAKRRPPYSVELDLGDAPTPRTVRVVGYADGEEVATDQLWLNQGQQRFAVRLIEPRRGGLYPGGLTARAVVQAPADQSVERVEVYLGDTLIQTLQAEPYEASMVLSGAPTEVVRAVAYLADGSRAEDAVAVGAAVVDEVVEVRLTEVYFRAVDAQGEAVSDLLPGDVRVVEQTDGAEAVRTVRSLEWLGGGALDVALVVDLSVSMADELPAVRAAAESLVRSVLAPDPDGDPGAAASRVGLLTFNETTSMAAPLSTDPAGALRAIASFEALGQTALYDAVAESLRFVDGGSAPRVVLLVTDGRDDSSSLTFDQALAAARESSALLAIVAALDEESARAERREVLQLADAAGGTVSFLRDMSDLEVELVRALEQARSSWRATVEGAAGGAPLRVDVDREGVEVEQSGDER